MPVGSRTSVRAVASTDRTLFHKLLVMGIVSGTVLEVVGIAPLGDPIQIRALNYDLSLRKSEARHILVEPGAKKFEQMR